MSTQQEAEAARRSTDAPAIDTASRPGCALLLACVAVALTAAVSLAASYQRIDGSLPYPQHVDERLLADNAYGVLRNNSLNPGTYRYPSLPIYLAALGMAAGMVQSVQLEGATHVKSFKDRYSHQPVMRAPRRMQAAMAAAAVVLAAWLAHLLGGGALAVVLAGLLLFASPAFYVRSWSYLNVDVVTALFASLALVQLARGARSPSFAGLVAWPAAFCGATIASKYTNGVILASGVLAIFLHAPRAQRMGWCTLFVALSLLAFLACCPYILFEPRVFLDDLLEQAALYGKGYGQYMTYQTGWPQAFRYVQNFVGDYGVLLSAMVPVGAAACLWRNPKLALAVLAFPVLLLAYVSGLKVQFVRNMLPAYPVLAALSAIGLWASVRWLQLVLLKRLSVRWASAASALIAALALGLSVPWAAIWDGHRPWQDSRNAANTWLAEHAPKGSLVVVPKGLPFQLRAGSKGLTVREAAPPEDAPGSWLAAGQAGYLVTPTFTVPHYNRKKEKQTARLNTWLTGHCKRPLAQLGTREIMYGASIGDPKLTICELAPP